MIPSEYYMARRSNPSGFAIFLIIVLLVLAIGSLSGCAHVQSTAGVPARNATPLEQALAYNDGLAQANRTLASAVINAQQQTPPLVTVPQANQVLMVQAHIADLDRKLTPLLVDSTTVSANSTAIQALLNQLASAGRGIQGDIGIKDPTTAQAVTNAVNQIAQFATLALQALTNGGLVK